MKKQYKSFYLPVLLSLILFLLLSWQLYPYCKYYIDPDSTAYLTIIERYASGDYGKAFNGYWSPLHPFLSGLLLRYLSVSPFQAALYINALASMTILVLSFCLFAYYRKDVLERWCFGIFSSVFWSVALYYQLVADQFGVMMCLCIFLVFIQPGFLSSFRKWFFVAVLSGIALYAKTYAPYAITLILFCYLAYNTWKKAIVPKKSIALLLMYLSVLLLIAFPYLYLIHEKYGIWSFGLAGKLNIEWNIVGTQLFKKDITVLVPPVYKDSISFWEDPFWVQGGWYGIFSNFHFFGRYILRLVFNLLDWVKEMNHLSFLFTTTWLLCFFKFWKDFFTNNNDTYKKLILINILFPAGLLMTHVEPRYLWPSLFSILIMTLYFYDRYFRNQLKPLLQQLFLVFFFGSFLIGSVFDARTMINTGHREFNTAKMLDKLDIHGAFVCNKISGSESNATILRLAYFSKNPYYYYPDGTKLSTKEILEDAKRHHVPYYYYFYKGTASSFCLLNAQGKPYKEVTGGKISGLLVFQIGKPSENPVVSFPDYDWQPF